MKILIACKRGNVSKRDKWGHCLCQDCKNHRYTIHRLRVEKSGYLKIWQQNNRGKSIAYSKKWNANNKEKRKDIVRSWRERNPTNVKLMNSKGGKKWTANNKGKRNASVRVRKLALINRTPIWADYHKITEFYILAEALTKQTGIPHEVDHIIPLQGKLVSGLHVHNNLQVITRTKNRSKRNNIDVLCLS